MSDGEVTVAELRDLVRHFVDQRDWQKFHAPKNLTMALAIEAAELMEHFQWIEVPESREIPNDPEKLAAVGEELIDVSETMAAKMKKNELKYPVEEFKGRYGPEDKG
jgi:hypothetical protein